MPRLTRKTIAVRRLEEFILAGLKHATELRLYDMNTSCVSEFIWCCYRLRKHIKSKRYYRRPRKYRKRKAKFDSYLDEDHADALSDKEFLYHFRLPRPAFWQIVGLIKDHQVFKQKRRRGQQPKAPEEQLMVPKARCN
mmetsp:Transcript_66968/g.75001  ORF Transcript_66968/g.75001 Transcript_66968/m.75001 type:complete len:138 (+) Transcript_66968:150-563(+)